MLLQTKKKFLIHKASQFFRRFSFCQFRWDQVIQLNKIYQKKSELCMQFHSFFFLCSLLYSRQGEPLLLTTRVCNLCHPKSWLFLLLIFFAHPQFIQYMNNEHNLFYYKFFRNIFLLLSYIRLRKLMTQHKKKIK